MRRYLQGTLDFHCGIYCVVNALSALYGIDLSLARFILADTVLHFSRYPELHEAFLFNRTDHYWVVAYMLARFGTAGRFPLNARQPFGNRWLVEPPVDSPFSSDRLAGEYLKQVSLYLPEPKPDRVGEAKNLALAWDTMHRWLEQGNGSKKPTRAVLLRFHRFLPGVEGPVVSHWTTALRSLGEMLTLFDASGESKAIHAINRSEVLPDKGGFRNIRIVPESIVLLSKNQEE